MCLLMSGEIRESRVVDRSTFQAELDALRIREKAHTQEDDAIAAGRLQVAALRACLIKVIRPHQ